MPHPSCFLGNWTLGVRYWIFILSAGLLQVFIQESGHLGISIETVSDLYQAMSFIRIAKVFNRKLSLPEGSDNLFRFLYGNARIIGAVDHHHRAADLVHMMNRADFLEKRPVLAKVTVFRLPVRAAVSPSFLEECNKVANPDDV